MKRRLFLLSISIGLTLLILFATRNRVLQWAFKKAGERLQTKYQLSISAAKISFTRMDNILVNNISLLSVDGDTLLTIQETELEVAVSTLFGGVVAFNKVQASNIHLHIATKYGSSHVTPSSNRYANSNNITGFHRKASVYYKQLLRLLNTSISLQHVSITYRDSTVAEQITIPQFEYDRQKFSAIVIYQNKADTLDISGLISQKEKMYFLQAHQRNSITNHLPLILPDNSFRFGFSNISCRLAVKESKNQMKLSVDASGQNVLAMHWRLADKEVKLPDAGLHAHLTITDHSIELDSTSELRLKNVKAKLYAQYTRNANTTFFCSLHIPETTADSFFHSLPDGMFHTLKGISCTGTLAYDLKFSIDSKQPDSLLFYSSLTKNDLRIVQYGKENFTRINAPFEYEVYDRERLVRTLQVGPGNPAFAPYQTISPYLIKSVLQSEDPSFMLHRGFLIEAFRESIIKNYKEKRFARGGSTISMQLVKNVFLSRDKTIARKAEEALIVYLIENLGLVSKERMLEVYLNVIEWGPGVYGIGEAAAFYFHKRPSELNLQESIFLACIIPNPKYFKYQFDKTGHIKSHMSGYFNVLSSRMLSKGWVNERDTANLLSSFQLQGRARQLIVPTDSIPSADMDNME